VDLGCTEGQVFVEEGGGVGLVAPAADEGGVDGVDDGLVELLGLLGLELQLLDLGLQELLLVLLLLGELGLHLVPLPLVLELLKYRLTSNIFFSKSFWIVISS